MGKGGVQVCEQSRTQQNTCQSAQNREQVQGRRPLTGHKPLDRNDRSTAHSNPAFSAQHAAHICFSSQLGQPHPVAARSHTSQTPQGGGVIQAWAANTAAYPDNRQRIGGRTLRQAAHHLNRHGQLDGERWTLVPLLPSDKHVMTAVLRGHPVPIPPMLPCIGKTTTIRAPKPARRPSATPRTPPPNALS